jgi:hypothetical protein
VTGNKLLLQKRDLTLLAETGIMRLIDRDLAKVIGRFGCTRRVNARLLKLTRAGLLNRFFVGTIGAGRKAIYTLSRKGSALVASPHRMVSRRFGQTVVGDLFVDHQMHINQVYAAAKFGTLTEAVSFLSWRDFAKPFSASAQLVPDAYFELRTPAGIHACFLEVDMGTETRAVWERKVRAYLHVALSGEFRRVFAHPQFKVLVLANSERRLANIRGVIAKQTDKIFYLATFEVINLGNLWSPLWLRPRGEERQRIL